MRLSRDTSLSASWKLINRWTSATAANAASTAPSAYRSSTSSTSMSTNVPSIGRARRILAEVACMIGQYLLHAFGQVGRRQRGAGNVSDVAVDLHRALAALADELLQPAGVVNFAAVGFPVVQNFDLSDTAIRFDGNRVIDQEVLADHVIVVEIAHDAFARLSLPHPSGLD